MAQEAPRNAPRQPKTPPRRSQNAPKTPPSGPQAGQDAQPERDMHPAGTRAAPTRAQKHARDASRSLRALILARFWKVFFSCTHFQMIFIDTWLPFASEKRQQFMKNRWPIPIEFSTLESFFVIKDTFVL